MTHAKRLKAAALIAMSVLFWSLSPGNSLITAEDKQNLAPPIPLPSLKQMKEVVKVQAETWRLQLRLEMPNLDPQAVLYAVFDHDPAVDYKSQVKQLRILNLQQLAGVDSKLWKEQYRAIQMKIDWDSCFAKLSGADVNLLTNRGIVVSSNQSAGKKWVVTKCVDTDSHPYCWSIPVEVTIGNQAFVTLDKNNTFDLQTPYDAVMNEPNHNGDKVEPKK